MQLAQFHQHSKLLFLILGPAAAAICYFTLVGHGYSSHVGWTGAITLLCAIWWISETIPIPVTSMLALALFPLVGVLTPAQVGEAYGSPTVLLVMGGFIMSTSMVRSGVHLRIALTMVKVFGGGSSKNLVFGFMAASALLSMWMSNAATVLMILPVALAILEKSKDSKLATPLLLGIAYACSIGSLGTPIGTPANLVFRQVYLDVTGIDISFFQWMSWGIPAMVIFLPIIALWLTRQLNSTSKVEVPVIESWKSDEKRVFIIFILTALAWMTRAQPFGGWSGLLNLPGANDASVVLIAVIAMFLLPNGKGEKILDWETAMKIPWGMLILLASGFAIARAFTESGLDDIIGQSFLGITTLPLLLMILGISLIVSFITELTSNTATTALLMPILAAMALAAGINPILLMLPAAMTSSCAFMLPIATVPNTVVFSTGRFSIMTMVKEGFMLNLAGVMVISGVCYWVLR